MEEKVIGFMFLHHRQLCSHNS